MRGFSPVRAAPILGAALLLTGCQGLRGFGLESDTTAPAVAVASAPASAVSPEPEAEPAVQAAAANADSPAKTFPAVAATALSDPASVTPVAAEGEVDVRRYLGPDYCPEIRIRESTEVLRQYEKGFDGDPAHVIWQASVGKTARECLYDGRGGLTLKVGISGRVAAGPKGGPQTVTLPLRIALVKYKEAIIASELHPLTVAIPPNNATVFSEVRELNVASPGEDRDFILYVGLDEKGEGLLDPNWRPPEKIEKPVAVVEEDVVEEAEPPPPPRKKVPAKPRPAQPNVLPTPSDGFVLSGG